MKICALPWVERRRKTLPLLFGLQVNLAPVLGVRLHPVRALVVARRFRWAGVFPPVVEKRAGGMAAAAPKRQQGDIVWAKYGRM
jgi:hypothetical protein